VYFRKEGRALGEVTKYLVYNLRKRGGDSADKYFRATELIAGVKDMRFQALMPDVLHWLGIKKVDNMVSMSDMYAYAFDSSLSFSTLTCVRFT
jgi:GTP cyclohydrolase II